MKIFAVAAVAAGLAFSGAANAAAINGLFNTGTDATNTALPLESGSPDSHYLITGSSDPSVTLGQSVTYYNPGYIADDANSRWISVARDGYPGNDSTTYELTFSLAGLDAATASISGTWGADNEAHIYLNGLYTGIALTGTVVGGYDMGDWASFQQMTRSRSAAAFRPA